MVGGGASVPHAPTLAWPSFAWAARDQLHAKGMIDDPRHTNTLITLTDAGVADTAAAFRRLFGVAGDAR